MFRAARRVLLRRRCSARFGTSTTPAIPICDNLKSRELLADCTSSAVDKLIQASDNVNTVSAYLGMDPTAKSLHVGNLAAIMALRVLQQDYGVRPVLVIGSATAMVGDPSGRSTERPLLDQTTIEQNAQSIAASLTGLLDFDCPSTGAQLVNNIDWHGNLNVLDFMRDTAIHFRLGTMLGKDSVRNRLKDGEQGLSLTEFLYMTLQAADFKRLYEVENCVLQIGGSDQWGNITAGVDLIRRTLRKEAAGITVPLITTASGEKLGKSAGNAVWLDAQMTSHYDFYQYWLRTQDDDVERLLKVFTNIAVDDIKNIMQRHWEKPEERTAQRVLADNATRLVRGDAGVRQAQMASQILFSGVSIDECLEELGLAADSEHELAEFFEGCDPVALKAADVVDQNLFHLFKQAGLVSSRKQFNRLLDAGGLYLNNNRVTPLDTGKKQPSAPELQNRDLIQGRFILLRSGKKNYKVAAIS